ncbi:MAG: MoxR family ATPase [Planctomycetota bacterium]|nr:MoxR family ATPase [Planctomycetota bacterium]
MKRRVVPPAGKIELAPLGNKPEEVHVFEDESVWALNAALAARRPLLVRGEPGVGKSQLARAVAAKEVLNCPLVSFVVDSSTESRDLLWNFDAVKRLAEAQISGALNENEEQLRVRLDPERFFHPGPLWWAFDWNSAHDQAQLVGDAAPDAPQDWNPGAGCVVLIDEIDKAESDVPNGLLESLGAGVFHPSGRRERIEIQGEPPLVVITTNEERVLPDAFVRRCLVFHMSIPSDAETLKPYLIERGRAHFGDLTNDDVLALGADMLVKDRFGTHSTPRPGQAEYLDLIRAVAELCPGDYAEQYKTLRRVSKFVVNKHAGASS